MRTVSPRTQVAGAVLAVGGLIGVVLIWLRSWLSEDQFRLCLLVFCLLLTLLDLSWHRRKSK